VHIACLLGVLRWARTYRDRVDSREDRSWGADVVAQVEVVAKISWMLLARNFKQRDERVREGGGAISESRRDTVEILFLQRRVQRDSKTPTSHNVGGGILQLKICRHGHQRPVHILPCGVSQGVSQQLKSIQWFLAKCIHVSRF
jgi:hypothetical protein